MKRTRENQNRRLKALWFPGQIGLPVRLLASVTILSVEFLTSMVWNASLLKETPNFIVKWQGNDEFTVDIMLNYRLK